MKVVHVVQSLDVAGGGLPAVVGEHLRWQAEHRIDTVAIQVGAPQKQVECGQGRVVTVPTAKYRALRTWSWSDRLSAVLADELESRHAICHIHGVWTAPQLFAARYANASGKRFIVSPHGQLLPQAFGSMASLSFFKKSIYLRAVRSIFDSKAAVLHAITLEESEACHRWFPASEVITISNSFSMPDIAGIESRASIGAKFNDDYILYLGRLDSRKGVSLLVEAFATAKLPESLNLLIVGPDSEYQLRSRLLRRIEELGMSRRISILEPVYGEEKTALIKQAKFVCIPSFHEVVGLVNLEAAALRVPVIASVFCGLEGWEENGGLLTDCTQADLVKKLMLMSSESRSNLTSRGSRLQRWVLEKYGPQSTQKHWMDTYERVMA